MLIYIFDGIGKKAVNQALDEEKNNISKEIELARKEWEYALKMFNEVSDPEVIDYIVYYIIAAERRYMHLLNKYKDRERYEKNKANKKLLEHKSNL